MKVVRLIWAFYKSFALVSLMLTMFGIMIFYHWGANPFFLLFWFKVATLELTYYFINNYKRDEFYYYKNLGLTKKVLWGATLGFDLAIFLFFTITVLILRE